MEYFINGETKICGLIGNPVKHTLSPMIHNSLTKQTGINLNYVPFPVEKENLEAAIKGAFALNIIGMNVTVPYKSQVMDYLSEVHETAKAIGAVNTLVRTSRGFKGYNTDMDGLHGCMISHDIKIRGENVIILGAGGAAKSAGYLCVREGAAKVYIVNRSIDQAQKLADTLNKQFESHIVVPISLKDVHEIKEDKCLAIQATSVGLYPEVDKAVIEDMDFYKKIHTGLDLIYNPEVTKFMKLVDDAGGKAYNGLKMLLYQGIIAYELWNNIDVNESTTNSIYELLREELKNHG